MKFCNKCGYNFYSGKYEFDDNDTQIIDTQQFIDSDNSNEEKKRMLYCSL